ncbi:MAG: undecaprenyl-diphosphate phosphatase [candidate division WOR-3 bacterium]
MTAWQALALGIVQGLTEMLPVSSDGHLAILQSLWRLPEGGRVGLTAALHFGTALALGVYFGRRLAAIARDVVRPVADARRAALGLIGKIALATAPAVLAGLLLEGPVEVLSARMPLVGMFLIANGVLLMASRFGHGSRVEPGWGSALVIGCAQAAALLPGVSRSGTTITVALLLGLAAPAAFEFSFLLAVPVTLGAAVLKMAQLDFSLLQPAMIALGVGAAFVSGLGAIAVLHRAVVRGRFVWFGVYCAVLGLVILVLTG